MAQGDHELLVTLIFISSLCYCPPSSSLSAGLEVSVVFRVRMRGEEDPTDLVSRMGPLIMVLSSVSRTREVCVPE